MSESNCTLDRGKNIIIHRKDGRQHSAIISSVNNSLETVTVEWYENGETKGKEIDFVDVYVLNPEFIPDKSISNKDKSRNVTNYTKTASTLPSQPNNAHNRARTLKNYSGAEIRSNYGNYGPGPDSVTSSVTLSKTRATRASMLPSLSETTFSKRPARPSVVDTIENIRKNREERRQRQAEAREEQKALMNIYPKNSNWKFGKMIRDYQSTLMFTPLRGDEPVESHQITVCVRKRPLSKKELSSSDIDVISVPKRNVIVVHEPKNKVDLTKYLENQHFYFDYTFDDTCSNETVYKYTAKPLIETIFDGGMATCFAYGQTGSGKTYTMGGAFSGKKQNLEKGIYLMAARDVFNFMNLPRYQQKNLMVSSTFFEIYQGKVYDLLAKKKGLRVLEDGHQQVQIVGLTEKVVSSPESVLNLLQIGNSARASGKTTKNTNSSRSHAVFQIILRVIGLSKVYGKFSLIDLAGNERGADTSSANKSTQMEGAEINKSLLALKECIRALGRKGSHLPFRQSKLTQVLRDSFVGENSKTCMIAMISPGMSSCEHTLDTLRYANRVKELVGEEIETKNDYLGDSGYKELLQSRPSWNQDFQEISEETELIQDEEFHYDLIDENLEEENVLISYPYEFSG